MTRKTAAAVAQDNRVAELEARYIKALETIDRMSQQQAQMAAQLGSSGGKSYVTSGQLVVGIRNVSNYSVGLLDKTSGQTIEYNLNPEVEGVADPRTCAVISYAFWQQLRTGKQVGRGMIIRDDSILGHADNAAPEDRLQDIHPDHHKNVVLNPREWIISKSEDELREAIQQITSEATLRRLLFAVDQEIIRIGELRYKGDEERARKSIRDLPALFRVVEELSEERLDELNPVTKVRHLEIGQSIRSR